MKKLISLLAIASLFCLTGETTVCAIPVSIKFTSDALGLGNSDINRGGTVDQDVPGFFTSSVTGRGSILQIQTNGLAGVGTETDPLLVTVTAQTHRDVQFDLPWSHDYQAGIIYLSEEKTTMPDGKDEGLGVRAFTVDGLTGLRTTDPKSGLVKIEGSKDVSGGTDNDTYLPLNPNGAAHVDEGVNFDFGPSLYADAMSVEVLLSKFEMTDIIDLEIKLTSGDSIDLDFLETSDTSIFEEIGDGNKLWKLKFSGIDKLEPYDLIDNFTIYANDRDPLNPRGTAEHFFITGISAEAVPIPEPTTFLILGFAGLVLRRRRE